MNITNGDWAWWVEGKDGSRKGGQFFSSQATSLEFQVAVPATPPPATSCGGSTVSEDEWTCGGNVQTAAGRIYFVMGGSGYVCSGTVVNDLQTGRSVILTAAHCVYDDAGKAFASFAMFIPDQANTTASGTDLECSNDPIGCWVVSFGVVDSNWANNVWPDNVAWDYAYYVVEDIPENHQAGLSDFGSILDSAAGAMDISFVVPQLSSYTYALGYSYSKDPSFRYCAQDMGTAGSYNWWLGSCGMSGGASGGPWTQSSQSDLGAGPVMSVNSWGYKGQPGMAGPKLNDNTASCLFDRAKAEGFVSAGIGVIGCDSNR